MEDNMQETIEIEPTVEPKQDEPKNVAVSNKEKRDGKDEKTRKKDDKSIEQILKGLNGLNTPEEKLSTVCKKYTDVVDENRKLQMTLKQMEKRIVMIQREKEQCQSEKSKAVLAKSRLESLCRELQRQNKAVKEESLLKIREEEEKRKEVSAKFQSTLAEITALMAETNEKNVKLHEDNIEIHKKFKSVFDEMDIREQHFESMHQVMKQELQVADAKLAKVTLEMTEERENLLKEKNLLLLKLTEYQSKIKDLQAVEINLRSQVEMYTEKYDEFQSALTKSNEIFGGFNSEMEKMSKKILKLEKETNMWKSRWEKSHAALLEMATDKQTRDAEIVQLNKKSSLLQELCKAFQQERASLLVQLKEKTNDPLQTDGNQLIENITNNSTLNGLALLDKIEDKVNDQSQIIKTEETCPIIKENDTSNQSEKIINTNQKEETAENKNESSTVTAETVHSEHESKLTENTPVAKVTHSDVALKDTEQNHVENQTSTEAVQVPLETKTSETLISETVQSNFESTKPLKPENDNEVFKIVEVDKTIEVSVINDTSENQAKEPVISTVESESNLNSHINNSDALISNEDVQKSLSTKKQKDGKKKKK